MPPSPLVFFVPSGALFLLALVLFVPRRSFAQRAARAEGTVVTYAIRYGRSQSSGPRRRRRHAVVQYVVDGVTYRVTSSIGQTGERWPIGTPLGVLYDGERPAEASIDSGLDLYFGAILSAIMGLVALVCGFGFLFTNR